MQNTPPGTRNTYRPPGRFTPEGKKQDKLWSASYVPFWNSTGCPSEPGFCLVGAAEAQRHPSLTFARLLPR